MQTDAEKIRPNKVIYKTEPEIIRGAEQSQNVWIVDGKSIESSKS